MSRLRLALGLSFLVLGCTQADPGVEGLTRGEFKDAGGPPLGDAAPSADAAKDGAGATDSGGGDSGTQTTAFTGAGAFASTTPTTSAVDNHNNNGVGVTPGKGVDCLSCHKNGGAGTEFLFAGTLFADQNGNTPLTGKEIRVRGSDGKAYSAYSDADGNFWYKPGNGEAIAFPAQTGARDGTNTALMVENLTATNGSSCNAGGCHDGNTQLYIHLP